MPIDIPAQYRADVQSAARSTGLSPGLVAAQIDTESGFDPGVTSPAGAEGIAQFEPGTWAQWGHGSPYNAGDAFKAYAAYMGSLLRQYHGNVRDALAAYNAGPGDLAAGYGYADHILSLAGEPDTYTTGSSPVPPSPGGPAQAQLTAAQGGSLLGSAGNLFHGLAVVLDRFFALFTPGQGWRLVFGASALVLLLLSVKSFAPGAVS